MIRVNPIKDEVNRLTNSDPEIDSNGFANRFDQSIKKKHTNQIGQHTGTDF